MKRIKLFMLMSIYVILLLQGCGSKVPAYDENQSTKSILNNSKDSIDYNTYLKKIWVDENWDGGGTCYPISFFITDIEDGMIKGKFKPRTIADDKHFLGDFTGTIQNGTADCRFDDKTGDKGNMILIFKENNQLEVSVEYIEQEIENESLNGTYLFRPYNLTDVKKDIDPLKTHSLAVDLNSWGNVNLVTVVFTGNKPYPDAFLTNDDNDILYRFGISSQNAFEVKDVSVEDMNNDGLVDIKIVTHCPEDPDIPNIERIFIQMENGSFRLSD